MAVLRLFASAREAAGVERAVFDATTVGDLLRQATARFGPPFTAVLAQSRVWVNGEPAAAGTALVASDEVAVLPPVSGGAVEARAPGRPDGHGARAPARRRRPKEERKVRFGVFWAFAVLVVATAGPIWMGLFFGATATLAAVQVVRSRRGRPERPVLPAAVGGPLLMALAAAWGPVAVGLAGAAVAGGTFAARASRWSPAAVRDVRITLLVALPLGLVAASPVLVRELGLVEPLVLLALAGAHDAGCYIVGTGAGSSWEGSAAGVASLVPVTLFAAVVLVPKFPEWAPFFLGALAAVLAPVGPPLASRLLGDRTTRAPALRRLDSLLVLGPAWATSAAVLAR